jgi:hypothetical protein
MENISSSGDILYITRVLEVDGYWIVNIKTNASKPQFDSEWKCFLDADSAYEYLEMHGVTDECEKK